MEQRRDDEKICVFVIMRQQYDQTLLNNRADHFATRAERRNFVVSELKQYAEVTQSDLRHTLIEMERNDMVSEPKVLWIANALYFEASKQAIYDLASRTDIEVIGYDQKVDLTPVKESSLPPDKATREITPNVTQVGADQVWDMGFTGQGVVVAVVDSGVNYDHLDLADHLWDGGPQFPHHGYDIGDDNDDPMDHYGHGTHCAGTVCGDGGGGRKTGMAPDVTLMCVKISFGESGWASAAMICDGMQWAIEHGCDIISLSYGGHSDAADKTLYRNTFGIEGHDKVECLASLPVTIYPNPAVNELHIMGEGIRRVEIHNILGQHIETVTVAGSKTVILNLEAYEAGLYVLTIHTSDGVTTTRFVK